MDIVCRAYQLCEEAGQPQGRDQEFIFMRSERCREVLRRTSRRTSRRIS
nr:DUF2934 domain-containing protein [uncultured Bradyrhizobium sp.]